MIEVEMRAADDSEGHPGCGVDTGCQISALYGNSQLEVYLVDPERHDACNVWPKCAAVMPSDQVGVKANVAGCRLLLLDGVE